VLFVVEIKLTLFTPACGQLMALSDNSDVVAWFSDELGAEVFAKFVATEGIPCHITEIRKATRFEQHGVHVQRNRIDDLRKVLRLKGVANGMTPTAARSMGSRLAREGIPCCVAGDPAQPSVESVAVVGATKEIKHIVAVPESFLPQALSLLNVDAPSDAELTERVSRHLECGHPSPTARIARRAARTARG
jgi:hypothetical protein